MSGMRRREFITLLGGAAAAWPLAARAQQGERVRRIGVLLPGTANDSEFQIRLGAFVQALALLGWDIGRNVSFDTRWATSNAAELDRHARELAALAPDVILANGSAAAAPLLQATRTVPIVFAIAADPVGAGLVDSLARPGGNATGFITFEYGISAKWLELLKEIAPGVKQVAVFRDPDLALGAGQFGAMQSVAPSFGVEVRPVDVRDAPAIERAITGFASTANGGLIVTGSAAAVVHRELIVRLAAQHKLPGVYAGRFYPAVGGLMSLGPNFADQFRQAAGYVDRILKGEKPADLPVQSPTKYELVINLKTAKALGLDSAADAARPRRRGDRMKRREFITLLGGAAMWPLAARAQQATMPLIGFLGLSSPDAFSGRLAAFKNGLAEAGFSENRNVEVIYRWAHDEADRLPTLAADLVNRNVNVIATTGGPAPAFAAKTATSSIPIVFATSGSDPIELGLVASMNRPGGNITGVGFLVSTISGKQLELLHETVPNAKSIGLLVNPANPNTQNYVRNVQIAADALGREVLVLRAATETELTKALETPWLNSELVRSLRSWMSFSFANGSESCLGQHDMRCQECTRPEIFQR